MWHFSIISMFWLQPPHSHQTQRRSEGAAVSLTARQLARQHYRPRPGSRERYLRASLARWRAGFPSYKLREARNNLQRHSRLAVPGWVQDRRTQYLQSIRGDETVNVNKPSPVSPQLTARSGQSAQLVQCPHCIRTHVNMHSDFGHPCNGTRFTWSLHDFILRAKEISRAFVYYDSLVSANGL
jgi:hypothetical protein